MDSPFQKAKKECTVFSWNLLSSISVLEAKEKLNSADEVDEKLQTAFDMLIEQHCKYLTSEAIH